jgi:hypothetical protein
MRRERGTSWTTGKMGPVFSQLTVVFTVPYIYLYFFSYRLALYVTSKQTSFLLSVVYF